MTEKEFLQHVASHTAPKHVSVELLALWYDAQGNWEKAHDLVADHATRNAAHLHAYLHRKEGDLWNADYWYRQAGEKRKEWGLEEEWEYLVGKFLSHPH